MQDRATIHYSRRPNGGFTIVELLIVIVVIGILGAIATVAYTGITQRATVASLQSDLSSAGKILPNDKTVSPTSDYPAGLSLANGGKGLKASNGAGFQYTADNTVDPKSFCLTATNGLVSFFVDQTGVIASGFCSGQVAPADNTAIVTTFAGSAASGYVDGPLDVAQFVKPAAMAFDSSGALVVADIVDHRIRKIAPAGVVTTMAGSTQGYTDGTGTAAPFNSPSDVKFDSSGTRYVVDYLNHRVRKVTPAGVVTTFAGGGLGDLEGTGTAAKFYQPRGIIFDSSDNAYLTDTVNDKIRKITPAAVVTTFAGSGTRGYLDGPASTAQFRDPRGITIDAAGNLYVADAYNNCIRKITPAGVVSTFVGTGVAGYKNGPAASAQFNEPWYVTADPAGNIYVADTMNHRIRKVTSDGTVTTIAGQVAGFGDGVGTNASFNQPRGITLDSTGKNLYVADGLNHRIRKIQLP